MGTIVVNSGHRQRPLGVSGPLLIPNPKTTCPPPVVVVVFTVYFFPPSPFPPGNVAYHISPIHYRNLRSTLNTSTTFVRLHPRV